MRNTKTLFKAQYFPGTLEAIAYDSAGKELLRNSLTTAGDETFITIVPERKELKANEQDLCFIQIILSILAIHGGGQRLLGGLIILMRLWEKG